MTIDRPARAGPGSDFALRARPLSANDWPLLESLFGGNGACGGCWCMWWRVSMGGKTWDAAKGAPNKRAFRNLVQSGAASGVLAFSGDECIGWCAVGPRAEFPRTERSKALARDWDDGTWAINCLFAPARWRGRDVATTLVAAAIGYAQNAGAREIEAYPQTVQPGSARPPPLSGPACRTCSWRRASGPCSRPPRGARCTYAHCDRT